MKHTERKVISNERNAGKKLFEKDKQIGGRNEVGYDKSIDKKENSNVYIEGMTKISSFDSSFSAIALSLDDDDFLNLLKTAAKPKYDSFQEGKGSSQYVDHRLDNAEKNGGLSADAEKLLAQCRREADLSQRNADIETGEQQRTVTAFIKGAEATSCTRELSKKCSKEETSELRSSLGRTKCRNGSISRKNSSSGLSTVGRISTDGQSSECKFTLTTANKETATGNNKSSAGDVSRATQTADKLTSIVSSFHDLNSISAVESGCVNKIAYIDEDEREDDFCSLSNIYFGQNHDRHMNCGRFKDALTPSSSIKVIRALNDVEDEEVMADTISKSLKRYEIGAATEANIMSDEAQRVAEIGAAVDVQGEHNDNPFTYSAGHLRFYGNRVGMYDMQKSYVYPMTNSGEAVGPEGEYDLEHYKGYVGPTFLSLIPANPCNLLLTRDLLPAHFNSRESFAKGLLNPTEDTRLNPQQVSHDNEMANQKNVPDKCAIAKKRKENKKAKEEKNTTKEWVAESTDGYVGNLSTEEILRHIEGDSKSKVKGSQKSAANASKEHSSAATNISKSSGGRKKSDRKERRAEKQAAKQGIITDSEVAALSTKMETMDIEKEKAAVTETAVESDHVSLVIRTGAPKAEPLNVSPKLYQEEDGIGAAAKIMRNTVEKTTLAEEGVDDEEQYMSADEGANSNISDDVYHTDEQSGASGSHDFISDGANYRADDEEITVPVTSEESEFIQVTARSKKRYGGAASVHHQQQQTSASGTDRRNVQSSSTVDTGVRQNVKARRGSVQLPVDSHKNLPPRGNNSPSPVDRKRSEVQKVKGELSQKRSEESSSGIYGKKRSFQKCSAPLRRGTLLLSEIIVNTLVKGQGNKSIVGKGSSGGAHLHQQQKPQSATSTSVSKAVRRVQPSVVHMTSPDCHSQPSTLKYIASAGSGDSSLPDMSPPESLSGVGRKAGIVAGGSTKIARTAAATDAPATRSWADIARKRLREESESRANEAQSYASIHDLPSGLRISAKEECSVSSASSVSGYAESTRKLEHGEQKRAVSVEAVESDSAVKDYSFFFDPNEPTGSLIREKGSQLEDDITFRNEPKEVENSEFFELRNAGIILNLDGGRRIVLPEGDIITTGLPTVVNIRQRPEIPVICEFWKQFTDESTGTVVKFKDYLKRKIELQARMEKAATKEKEESK